MDITFDRRRFFFTLGCLGLSGLVDPFSLEALGGRPRPVESHPASGPGRPASRFGHPASRGHPQADAFQSLVEAERAFARDARDGVSEAFVRALGEEGLVFAPGPVNGREHHAAQPLPPDVVLSWHPRVAAVSLGGDLGYTSGPYVARSRPDADRAGYGHYLSIWRRSSENEPWRLRLDIGTPHGPLADQDAVPPDVRPLPDGVGREAFQEPESVERKLVEASEGFHEALGVRSLSAISARWLDDRTRAYRTGVEPAGGPGAMVERLGVDRGDGVSVDETLLARGVAVSRDLAWILRGYRVEGPTGAEEAGNLVEIWVAREDGWKLVVGLRHVHP
ncbi:MAG: hypothetical protein PVI57_15145 [Gemmatimonadota bacterium]|jgi:hypothetical protein